MAKEQLRDWIESRLPNSRDERPIAWELNQELKRAGLVCDDNIDHPVCDWGSPLGYVGPVKVQRDGSHLVVQTGVGIICGFDESAYIYQWKTDRWVRRWHYENDDYSEKKYVPEELHAVLIAPTYKNPQPLVLTLATYPWCTSTWNSVIYSLWRLGPDEASARLLLKKREDANRGARLPPIMGSVGQDDALIEFISPSLDCQMLMHTAIRHYEVDGSRVKRVGPLAVSPQDFVEEWLKAPWSESLTWSERDLQKWHLAPQACKATFHHPRMHCPKQPDLWQIALANEDRTSTYFLVRWRPPYEFTVVDVNDHPWPECSELDRTEFSFPSGTLFPVQNWRE
jgi:hypothetical protein